MIIRSDTYELTRLRFGRDYREVANVLNEQAMIHSVAEDREQFYMPGGKITLQFRYFDDRTLLDVKRICWRKPRYVKNIIKELGGVLLSATSERRFSPDKNVEFIVESQFIEKRGE